MWKIEINGTDIKHTSCFTVKVDFPISYESFCTDKIYEEIKEYIEKYSSFWLFLLTIDLPKYIPFDTEKKIMFFLHYDVEDYYKDILGSLFDLSWHFLLSLKKDEEERKQDLIQHVKDWNYKELNLMLDSIKSIANENNILIRDEELDIILAKHEKNNILRHICNSYILWIDRQEVIDKLEDKGMEDEEVKKTFSKIKRVFERSFVKHNVKKNQIINYILFLLFLGQKDLFVVFPDKTNTIYLSDSNNLSKCVWGWSIIISLGVIVWIVYNASNKKETENIKKKFTDYIENNFWDERIFSKIVEDIRQFMKNTGKWRLGIEYDKGSPTYMDWEFKTDDLDKYHELKEMTSDFWYVAPRKYKWKTTSIIWKKQFKYKKDWNQEEKSV